MVFWSVEDTDVPQEKRKIVISGNELFNPKVDVFIAGRWSRNHTETTVFRVKKKQE